GQGLRPRFLIRYMADISICLVKPYQHEDETFNFALKNLLGLVRPTAGSGFVAGTRSSISPHNDVFYIITEGEREGALYYSLSEILKTSSAVFEQSHSFLVLRFEGRACEDILMEGTQESLYVSDFPIGCIRMVNFDGTSILMHRHEIDRWGLYIPLSAARSFY